MLSTSSSNLGLEYLEARNRNVLVHANAVDYDDIIRLFTHRHTSSLFKRQAAAFRQIAREKKEGLAMSDLDPVGRVIQLGLDRLEDLSAEGLPSDVFVKPLCSLVRLFGLPYVKKSAYEEFDNGESLALVLTMLVRALSHDEPELIHAVAQTVMSFTAARASREFELRCELVATSGMVEALVLCLQRNAGDLGTALPLVTACRQLASVPSLALLFDGGVFDVLVALLERDFREPLVLEVVQLLWLLMDQPSEQATPMPGGQSVLLRSKPMQESGSRAAILSFATLRSVSVLSDLLRQAFQQGYRAVDKQVRNDLLVLLILVAREPSAQKLLDETGILGELIAHATQAELKVVATAQAQADKTATVGLSKIRALRSSASGSPNGVDVNTGFFDMTSEFVTVPEDMQFKMLIWSLLGACAEDPACHARLVASADGGPSCSAIQVALLYLDTADAFNTRAVEVARQAEVKRALQNQAMTGTINAASTMPPPPALTASQAAAAAAMGKLSFSQLLHLQGESLRLLASVVPRAFEAFKAARGVERVLNFAVAVLSNESRCEEKRLNAAAALALQAKALVVLVRACQAGTKIAATCPVTVGTASVDSGSFSRTLNATIPAAQSETTSSSSASATAVQPNSELQELLATDGDEAFAAVQAAMIPLRKQAALAATASAIANGASPTKTVGGSSLLDAASVDSAHVLSVLLALFNDPQKPAELRSDAISCVALLVARCPPLQRQLRQLKGVHILVQFLGNDGARVTAGLDVAAAAGVGATLAAAPSSQTNLKLYAAKHPQLLLSVVDCLWRGVIGVRTSEDVFLALNGLDLTLDLLLIAPPPSRKQILGFLADLLAVPTAPRFLYEWRAGPGRMLPDNGGRGTAAGFTVADTLGSRSQHSSTASLPTAAHTLAHTQHGFTALDLLLSFWPEASLLERNESRMHSELVPDEDSEDDLTDAHDGHPTQADSSLTSIPRITSNQNLRPALYSVFARLGFKDDNPFFSSASPVQRGQIFSIAHYVDSLRSSTLNDIAQRLSNEGVKLVPEDAAFLEANTRHLDEAASQALDFQNTQWRRQQAQDQQEIERYLHGITSRKEQNEAFLLSSARRARKQTMHRRLLYKQMREQMLQASADESRPSRQGRQPKNSSEEKSQLTEEEQQRLDEEDAELESRLLRELSTSPMSPTRGGPIRLATGSDDLSDSDSSVENVSPTPSSTSPTHAQYHRMPVSPTPEVRMTGKYVVSRLDPAAERALLAARMQQKERQERQAAISAALHQQSSSFSIPAPQAPTTKRSYSAVQPSNPRRGPDQLSVPGPLQRATTISRDSISQLGKPPSRK